MSLGDLTQAEMQGLTECPTPACGNAEVWTIGRLRLIICQRCAAHHGYGGPLRPTKWISTTHGPHGELL